MSKTNFISLEFTWKIKNYSQQKLDLNEKGPGPLISSQAFGCGNMKFTLRFYPQGGARSSDTEVSNGEKWTSLYLLTESSKKYGTNHHVEFSILDENGEKFGFRCFHKKIIFKNWGYTKFIRQTDLEDPANNLLPDDTLTIYCRVKGTKSKRELEKCNCQIEEPQTKRARRQLGQDLASLLDDKFTDFVFKVENVKIPAHRAILTARSPVFAAMFQHNMQENRTNETEVTDVTPAAFKALLRFIYTDHCEVGSLAEEILVAANKYDIQELKQICARKLRKNLTVENAARLLVLSDLHQVNDLKDGAIRFINENAAAVMKTPTWPAFSKSHPYLILELYSKLVD